MISVACARGAHLECDETEAALEGGVVSCRCPCHYADDPFDADELGLDPDLDEEL